MNSKIWLSGKKHLTVCNHNNLTDYDNQATNKNDPRASFCILHCIAYFIDRFVRISVNKIENVLNIPATGATTDSIDGLKDDPDQFNNESRKKPQAHRCDDYKMDRTFKEKLQKTGAANEQDAAEAARGVESKIPPRKVMEKSFSVAAFFTKAVHHYKYVRYHHDNYSRIE